MSVGPGKKNCIFLRLYVRVMANINENVTTGDILMGKLATYHLLIQDPEDDTAIWEKLRQLRLAKGYTQKQLAKKLGYNTHSHISELESGKAIPTAEFSLKTARLFAVSVDVLLDDELDLN